MKNEAKGSNPAPLRSAQCEFNSHSLGEELSWNQSLKAWLTACYDKGVMRSFVLLAMLCVLPLWAGEDDCPNNDCNSPESRNVNARYTVESFSFTGNTSYRDLFGRLSDQLQEDLRKLVGQKFNPDMINRISQRIRDELHASLVTTHCFRGEKPDSIRVQFETTRRRLDEDATVTKLSYQSKLGWTGGIEAATEFAGNHLVFGVQSDGDTLVERQAGINARISRPIGDRVQVRFAFEDFHEQWNGATLNALAANPEVPGIYRSRQSFSPSVTVVMMPGLTWTAGVSFQNFQTQFPAARTESANAVVNTLRYHRFWEKSEASRQEVEAGYTLRAATRTLDTDYAYTRHSIDANWAVGIGQNHEVSVRFAAGMLNGEAPLFERFILGNSSQLRGFNKYDISPLGASHMAYGSLNYRYRMAGVFYDTGSVWENRADRQARQSAGVTLALGPLHDGLLLSCAFPLQDGRHIPMFMLTANF